MLLPVFGCLLCTKYSMSIVVARCIFPCILSAKEKLRVMHTTEIEQSEEEDRLFTKQGECESCWWRPSLQNLVKSWTDFLQGVFARRGGGLLLFTWQNKWITLRQLTPFCKTWWKLDLTFTTAHPRVFCKSQFSTMGNLFAHWVHFNVKTQLHYNFRESSSEKTCPIHFFTNGNVVVYKENVISI